MNGNDFWEYLWRTFFVTTSRCREDPVSFAVFACGLHSSGMCVIDMKISTMSNVTPKGKVPYQKWVPAHLHFLNHNHTNVRLYHHCCNT